MQRRLTVPLTVPAAKGVQRKCQGGFSFCFFKGTWCEGGAKVMRKGDNLVQSVGRRGYNGAQRVVRRGCEGGAKGG